jgi:hypothetical protein
MEEWFVGRNGKRVGPHRSETLRTAAIRGKLKPDDLLWCEGMENWSRADALTDFASLFPKMPSVPEAIVEPTKASPTDIRSRSDRAPKSNYLVRHWRGDLSLPVSYWINFVIVSAVGVGLIEGLSASGLFVPLSATGTGIYILARFLLITLISIWSVVGVVRSAGHHTERGGKRGWAQVAQVLACIGLIRFTLLLIAQSPIVVQAFTLASGHDTTPASQLRVLNRATEVEIEGGLSFGTANSLKTILDAAPTIKLVQLNNAGGWITEGERMAQLIKYHHLATYTSRECDSACLLVFLAGTDRFIGARARLGFHQASVAGITGEVAAGGNRAFRAAMTERGVPEDFIKHALSTPASSIWYPTLEELKQAHLITAVVDETRFGQTGIDGWQDPVKLERDILAVPLFAALAKAEPQSYEQFKNSYIADIQAGIPQQEAAAKLHSLLRTKIIPTYLRYGFDAPLVTYWRTQIEEMRELRVRDPKSCLQFMHLSANRPNISQLISPEAEKADLDALVQLLNSGKGESTSVSKAAVQPAFYKVALRAEQEMAGSLELIFKGTITTATPAQSCDAMVTFYQAVLSLPTQEAGPLLKYLSFLRS